MQHTQHRVTISSLHDEIRKGTIIPQTPFYWLSPCLDSGHFPSRGSLLLLQRTAIQLWIKVARRRIRNTSDPSYLNAITLLGRVSRGQGFKIPAIRGTHTTLSNGPKKGGPKHNPSTKTDSQQGVGSNGAPPNEPPCSISTRLKSHLDQGQLQPRRV